MKTKNFKKRKRPTKKKRHRKTKKHQQQRRKYRGGTVYEGNISTYKEPGIFGSHHQQNIDSAPSPLGEGYLRLRYNHTIFAPDLQLGDQIRVIYPIENSGQYITIFHDIRPEQVNQRIIEFDIPYTRAAYQQAYDTWLASQQPRAAPQPAAEMAEDDGEDDAWTDPVFQPPRSPRPYSSAAAASPPPRRASPPPRRGGPPPSFNQSSARTRTRARSPPSSPPRPSPSSPPRACPPGKYCPGYSWSDDIGGCKYQDQGDFPAYDDCARTKDATNASTGPAYTAQDKAHILRVLAGHGIDNKRKLAAAIRTMKAHNDINLPPAEAIVVRDSGRLGNLDTLNEMIAFAKDNNFF